VKAAAELSDVELLEAKVLALALTQIEAARTYGLITGGPEINLERINEVLEVADERGIEASPADVDAALAQLVEQMAAA
jgi:hypothetical protein